MSIIQLVGRTIDDDDDDDVMIVDEMKERSAFGSQLLLQTDA